MDVAKHMLSATSAATALVYGIPSAARGEVAAELVRMCDGIFLSILSIIADETGEFTRTTEPTVERLRGLSHRLWMSMDHQHYTLLAAGVRLADALSDMGLAKPEVPCAPCNQTGCESCGRSGHR